VNPAILWDFSPSEAGVQAPDVNDRRLITFVLNSVERYREELDNERKRQADIKRKYGLKSLDYLVRQLDADLAELYERQAKGEKVDLPIRNKEEQKKRYEEAKKELRLEIELEQNLSISMPELLTVVYITPAGESSVSESAEIEKIGMEIAMEYERMNDREPEDVSVENLGFDIRSRGKDGLRYIEVKARAGEGEVALTPNEWFKAKRFKDKYYLYIVTNAKTDPAINIIKNPAENLNAEERVEVVRFIVSSDEWKLKKEQEVKWVGQ